MTDHRLNSYLVLIFFMLKKKKNPCPQKNLKDFD